MRSGLLAFRAAGAAAVLVLGPAAGAVYAGEDEGHAKVRATVYPAVAAPGGDVDVQVHGCKGKHGVATSKAFVADAKLSSGREGKDRPLYGDTTVASGLAAGTYPVSVHCDGRTHHEAGTVQVAAKPSGAPTVPGVPAVPVPSAVPTAPVKAGGGGTAATLAADERGPGTPHTVIGLVLAGVAAVAVAYRSARSRRRSDTD
ncbi:hypothetical protein NX801_02925 [Streptomyces sp. LP05-1]|uniref:Uncharacterized protein n=1 Tax=Streptomyces pyxinae TaxID=2970734 RepID=A0ABT2CB84_9ACTN|nr:hypothetical protein [Streptomyces sp. LP05-1]MCS0634626.1 hypothetical protein [Streptomyces sp. LP05-1]